MGLGKKHIYKFKNKDKTTFFSPVEIKAPTLITNSPEERTFVVDSGASMYMLSKRDFSPAEMDTLRRSRTRTVVLTANWEVQTNEEAQVFVHDLDLFLTVQVLDDTPAVLSLGKLCSEHGCSYEWVSGQEPRLTKNGKNGSCKADNFEPLVVSGLSSRTGSTSSSTSRMQDSTSSESQGPDKTRSDSQASRNRSETDPDKKDVHAQLQLPEWLEDITENLEDPEILAHTHIYQEDSDSERPTKVVAKSKLRMHSIYTHFPKDRNCDVS